MINKTRMILPDLFLQRMKKLLITDFDEFVHSFDNEVLTSVRINKDKYDGQPQLKPVDYCTTGYFVPQRPMFTIDPFIHAGVYYVQEASSMFLEVAMKQIITKTDLKVLDLCAAPGGKSTHLLSLLPNDSLLVSNEVIRTRGQILSENLKKWGSPNVIVTNNDPHDFQRMSNFFDVMVIDAPCSGEGLFRRDENAIKEWSPDNAQLCAQRQQRILADVWPALKEGGILIYSTCTFNPGENEENLQWLSEFASIASVKLEIDPQWGVTETEVNQLTGYRFYPHKVKGEGFFMAVVRKTGEGTTSQQRKSKENPLQATKGEKEQARKLFSDESLDVLRFEESLLAFPSQWIPDLLLIKNNLRILHAGIKIGEIKQKDLLPAHELALSPILKQSEFPLIELSIEDALSYLKRDEIVTPGAERGWNLITYRNIPLGWVKNLGNRCNSGFPKEWRIRMSLADYKGVRLIEEMKKFPL